MVEIIYRIVVLMIGVWNTKNWEDTWAGSVPYEKSYLVSYMTGFYSRVLEIIGTLTSEG